MHKTASPILGFALAGWGEGNGSDHGGSAAGANQATWNNRLGSSGSPWTTAGGDFSPTVSATRAIAGFGTYSFSSTANLVSDVQGWLVQSESEVTPTSIRRFANRTDVPNAPTLTIQYTAAPEPTTLSLGALGLLAGGLFRRRAKAV